MTSVKVSDKNFVTKLSDQKFYLAGPVTFKAFYFRVVHYYRFRIKAAHIRDKTFTCILGVNRDILLVCLFLFSVLIIMIKVHGIYIGTDSMLNGCNLL